MSPLKQMVVWMFGFLFSVTCWIVLILTANRVILPKVCGF